MIPELGMYRLHYTRFGHAQALFFVCFMTCPVYKTTPKLLQNILPTISRLIREYIRLINKMLCIVPVKPMDIGVFSSARIES